MKLIAAQMHQVLEIITNFIYIGKRVLNRMGNSIELFFLEYKKHELSVFIGSLILSCSASSQAQFSHKDRITVTYTRRQLAQS